MVLTNKITFSTLLKVTYRPLGKHSYNKHALTMIICLHFTQTQFLPHRKKLCFYYKGQLINTVYENFDDLCKNDMK